MMQLEAPHPQRFASAREKTQAQVVWEQFRRQTLAVSALLVLMIFAIGALFAPLIAPYGLTEELTLEGVRFQPPTRVYVVDPVTGLPDRPFVYATSRKVNQQTFATEFLEDRGQKYYLRFFASRPDQPYKILGLIPADLRLFSVDAPARVFLLGSDARGRDLFSRLWYGAQVSLTIGLVAVSISFAIGVVLGGLAGYYGGVLDALVMRLSELLGAIPPLFLLIALSTLLPQGLDPIAYFYGVVVMLGLTGWGELARSIRSQILSLRETDYVTAGRALGASEPRVIARHILPNTASYLIVLASLMIPAAILAESALSFVGRGIREPFSSWGLMLADVAKGGVAALSERPWTLASGFFILLTVLCWNLLGDGLRAAFDPKKRR